MMKANIIAHVTCVILIYVLDGAFCMATSATSSKVPIVVNTWPWPQATDAGI